MSPAKARTWTADHYIDKEYMCTVCLKGDCTQESSLEFLECFMPILKRQVGI